MKFHFISSIVFSVSVTLLTLNDDLKTRMLYLVAVLILFYVSLISFALDYDKEKMKQWHHKEKRLIEETYEKYVEEHGRKKKKSKK